MCLEKSSMPFLMETYSWSKEQRPAGKQAVFTPVFLEEREAPPQSLFLTMVTRLNHIFSISASLPTAITEPLNIKNVSLNQKLKRNVLIHLCFNHESEGSKPEFIANSTSQSVMAMTHSFCGEFFPCDTIHLLKISSIDWLCCHSWTIWLLL